MRLPAGSEERLKFIASLVSRLVDAFNRGDLEGLLECYHPDLEMRTGFDSTGGVWGSDLDEQYRGHEGLMKAAELWAEPWEGLRIEPYELIDLGGDRFIARATWHGRGRGSGVEVETPASARYTLRDGRIAIVEWFGDAEDVPREWLR